MSERTDRFWTVLLRVGSVLALMLIAASGIFGFLTGIADWDVAQTLGQQICAGSEVLHGGFGTIGVVGLLARQRWARPALWLWVVFVVITTAMAPVVWGGATILTGIGSGLAMAVLGPVMVWGARRVGAQHGGTPA